MKKILLLLAILLVSCKPTEPTNVLRIHTGLYAFCGASAAVPTGKKITIQGVEFDEGCAICPVLNGPSIYSLAMNGDGSMGPFDASDFKGTPDGTDRTVWSLFWYFSPTDTIPQLNTETKEWEMMAPNNRKFVIDMSKPSTSESDMFQMPCEIWKTENGILLSKCYGPLNHMAIPLRRPFATKDGQTSVTAAPEGAPYPVGTPIPPKDFVNQQKLSFNEMVAISQQVALTIQPRSNFYEASATKNENGIKSIFQGVDNTTIIVGVTSKGKVVSEVIDTPFLEDLVIQLPVKITLEQAEQLLLDAGYGTGIEGVADWSIVVLRRPLGPEETPALYIFTTSKGYVNVNTITGVVSPAYDSIDGCLCAWSDCLC